ncbi:MAG: IPTL-CTERM sorting domain-containing protein [Burkholderiales bacterium]|nr:IPTL-CTERM sorting domain-containing protein [Burkholderiales bacterium]
MSEWGVAILAILLAVFAAAGRSPPRHSRDRNQTGRLIIGRGTRRVITCARVTRSLTAAVAFAGALLATCGTAAAQDSASIVILPSATPSTSDQVIARITYAMAECGNFAPPIVTREPGGVIRLRVAPVRPAVPVPSCVVTFDVTLGMFSEGNYYVLFEPGNAGVLATASFWAGAAPIPTISEWGIAILAILVAVLATLNGRAGLALRVLSRQRPRQSVPSPVECRRPRDGGNGG